mmetsp:Transcript_40100/g.71985  ORF Transcript_40100/g.71985 Transcript_40100/m.71985 type:complete len:216 (+) Transcript_40100:169-816(+)
MSSVLPFCTERSDIFLAISSSGTPFLSRSIAIATASSLVSPPPPPRSTSLYSPSLETMSQVSSSVSSVKVVYGSAIRPKPLLYPSPPSVMPSNCKLPFRYASPKARLSARRPPTRHVPPSYRTSGIFLFGFLPSIRSISVALSGVWSMVSCTGLPSRANTMRASPILAVKSISFPDVSLKTIAVAAVAPHLEPPTPRSPMPKVPFGASSLASALM